MKLRGSAYQCGKQVGIGLDVPELISQAPFYHRWDRTVLVRYMLYKTVMLVAWPGGPTFGAHVQKGSEFEPTHV